MRENPSQGLPLEVDMKQNKCVRAYVCVNTVIESRSRKMFNFNNTIVYCLCKYTFCNIDALRQIDFN